MLFFVTLRSFGANPEKFEIFGTVIYSYLAAM